MMKAGRMFTCIADVIQAIIHAMEETRFHSGHSAAVVSIRFLVQIILIVRKL